MSKSILITGGAGFVGSSIAIELKTKYPAYTIIAVDNLKRRGSELNIARLTSHGVKFIHGDIRNREDLDSISEPIDSIIEASAEPSVLAGIDGLPDYLLNTNLVGTINCLNFAVKKKASFIFLSTSRIYPIENIENIRYTETDTRFEIDAAQSMPGVSALGISEHFPLEGFRSLYGASKLCSELIIQEYTQFYGIKAVINRCGVLTGPWQMGKVDQGVVVLWAARHFWNKPLSYIGYGGLGKQVRDMLHVKDLFHLVDIQMHGIERYTGQLFNVGGGREVSLSLRELTTLCKDATGNTVKIDAAPEGRKADIRLYITDNSRITALSGWKPVIMPEQIISEIVEWLREYETQLKPILA